MPLHVSSTMCSSSTQEFLKYCYFFILIINQLGAQNLFYNKFISCLYMFRAPCARRQEVKILLFWPPDDEHMVFETCRGMK